MKKERVKIKIYKVADGYSAGGAVKNGFILTEGDNFNHLKEMILEAVNLHFEETGVTYTLDEIELSYDISSFFESYKGLPVNNIAARIGMKENLLHEYISDIKKPTLKQTSRILEGIRSLGREMAALDIVV